MYCILNLDYPYQIFYLIIILLFIIIILMFNIFQIIKYMLLAVILFILIKYLPDESINMVDTLILVMIILVLFIIFENIFRDSNYEQMQNVQNENKLIEIQKSIDKIQDIDYNNFYIPENVNDTFEYGYAYVHPNKWQSVMNKYYNSCGQNNEIYAYEPFTFATNCKKWQK